MSPSLSESIHQFLRFLKVDRRYSDHTVQCYARDIQKLHNYCTAQDLCLSDLSPKQCRAFLTELNQSQTAPSRATVARLISANRTFFKFLITTGMASANPWEFIKAPKKDQLLPKVLFKKELHQFLDSLPVAQPAQIRLKAICELLYSVGLRISECLALTLTDIDLVQSEVRILGKGQKIRVGYFGDTAKHWLDRYLNEIRPRWATSTTTTLFLNQRGGPLSARSVQRALKEAATAAGLSVVPTPHSLRHCFASQLYSGGADLRSVQELLGHQHLTTTQIYTHLSDESLENTYMRAHPRARKGQNNEPIN